jgi:transposase
MSHFRPITRDVHFLLPPPVQDWLPEGHLARYVVEVVEGLDISALERADAGRGSLPYDPAMLLSLLIYGYATGRYFSSNIERATYDSLAFRFIAANTHPDTLRWPPSGGVLPRSLRPPLFRCCRSPARTSSAASAR